MAKLARHLTLMHEIAGSNFFFCLHFFFHGKNLVLKELRSIKEILTCKAQFEDSRSRRKSKV